MEARIETEIVQNPKISVSFGETGDLEHQLTFKCLLKPGDTDRLIHMFKERVQYGTPIILAVYSPQARLDMKFTAIEYKNESKSRKAEKITEDIVEEFSKTTPLSFRKVDCEILEGQEHPYRIKIDDVFEGEGDSARDAAIVALVGSNQVSLQAKDGNIIKQLTTWLKDNYPVTEELERLIYILENDTFEVPVKAH